VRNYRKTRKIKISTNQIQDSGVGYVVGKVLVPHNVRAFN